jgi:hypothetical protein
MLDAAADPHHISPVSTVPELSAERYPESDEATGPYLNNRERSQISGMTEKVAQPAIRHEGCVPMLCQKACGDRKERAHCRHDPRPRLHNPTDQANQTSGKSERMESVVQEHEEAKVTDYAAEKSTADGESIPNHDASLRQWKRSRFSDDRCPSY